jgi:hypothetical protein
LEYF